MLKLTEKSSEQSGALALLDAMAKDKIHLARFILDALDCKIVNARTQMARTPLMGAVLLPEPTARARFVCLLLERGADVNCQDDAGRTALSYACEAGCLDAVKALVQKNADPELVDFWGNTALIYATVAGHSAVVEYLVRAFKRLGLEIDRPNRVGNSAMQIARYLGHRDCVLALSCQSRKGSNPEVANQQEAGSKQVRSGRSSREVVAELVQQDAEPKLGMSPLHQVRKGPALALGSHPLPTLERNRSLTFKKRLESMDSINEEEDKDSDSFPDSPGQVFSSVLTPRPRLRSWSVQYGNNGGGQGDGLTDGCLPPFSTFSDIYRARILAPYSPRPNKPQEVDSSADAGVPIQSANHSSLPSPLGILLTPIPPLKGGREGFDGEKPKYSATEAGVRRFNESYYQKRSSLPTSALSPAPPDRILLPLRKAKNLNLAGKSGQQSVPSASNSPSFSILGNKLFRRFTFPDFRKQGREIQGATGGGGETTAGCSPELALRAMLPRSETFHFGKNHPQVGSKPSIDSISGVKCEFDFQFKSTS